MSETKNLIDALGGSTPAPDRKTLEETFPVLYRKLQPSQEISKSYRRQVEVLHYRMKRFVHPFWKDIHPV